MRFIDLNWDINNLHKYPRKVNEIHSPVLFGGGQRLRVLNRIRITICEKAKACCRKLVKCTAGFFLELCAESQYIKMWRPTVISSNACFHKLDKCSFCTDLDKRCNRLMQHQGSYRWSPY